MMPAVSQAPGRLSSNLVLRPLRVSDLVASSATPDEAVEIRARVAGSALGASFTTRDLLDAQLFDLALFSSRAQPEHDALWRSAALSFGMMAVAGMPRDTPHGSLQCVRDLMRMLAHHYTGQVPMTEVQSAIDAVKTSTAVKLYPAWANTQSHVLSTAGVTTLNLLICLCTVPSNQNLFTISAMSRLACVSWTIHEEMMQQGVGDLPDDEIERRVLQAMPSIEQEQQSILRRVLDDVSAPGVEQKVAPSGRAI